MQTAHQASDFGLVHEAQRDDLQMGEHCLAQVEEQVLGSAGDNDLHRVITDIIDCHHAEEDRHIEVQQVQVGCCVRQGFVDGCLDHQRHGQLGQGEQQHRRNRHVNAALVGHDVMHEAPDHERIEGAAEQFLVLLDLRADDRQRSRPGRRACAIFAAAQGVGLPAHRTTSSPAVVRACNS